MAASVARAGGVIGLRASSSPPGTQVARSYRTCSG